jgi:DNA polymerase-3 subunit epsilon
LDAFLADSELVIHNAPFDVGFLNAEIARMPEGGDAKIRRVEDFCEITDSLSLARRKHPGQKNNLDALCRRYMVDNSQRDLHGALLDAEILADVFLLMTGGQAQMFAAAADQDTQQARELAETTAQINATQLQVIRARPEEVAAHQEMLDLLDQRSDGKTLWRQ